MSMIFFPRGNVKVDKLFKCAQFQFFFKGVSEAHQGCIYHTEIPVKTVILLK